MQGKFDAFVAEAQRKFEESEQHKLFLLRDLQNRCEKVIDLEVLLDELREKYDNMVAKSSTKVTEHKNTFMERTLEYLKNSHTELVQQTNALKIENQISDKKLSLRDSRIQQLEAQLLSSDERARVQQEELQKLQDELVSLRAALAARPEPSAVVGRHSPPTSRIVRPVRGGGAVADSSNPKPRSGIWSLISSSSSSNLRGSISKGVR